MNETYDSEIQENVKISADDVLHAISASTVNIMAALPSGSPQAKAAASLASSIWSEVIRMAMKEALQ